MKKIILYCVAFICCITSVSAQKTLTNYKFAKDISYYETSSQTDSYIQSQCRLDVYYPENKKDFITIVWLHGGGLTEGSRHIPDELKEKGVAVVPVSYRLSPKAQHPAYIEDAAAAVAWTKNNISKYGGNPGRIIVAGHSAGGYLALMVALDKSWLNKYSIDANDMMMYYPLSGQCATHYTIRREKGLPEDKWWIDEYAPIFHVRKETAPIILTTGGRDQELPLRYEENYILKKNADRFENKNITLYELQGFDHGSMCSPGLQLLLNILKNEIK